MSKPSIHPNVVPLPDVTAEPLCFTSDQMLAEDLLGYIARHPDADRLSLLSDVAEGLNYLHSCGMIHGNLNGSNIFVDATGHARITASGLATATQDLGSTEKDSAERSQSPRWIAPEILGNQGTYSKESDVFSFAGVTIETFTGAIPFSDMSPHAAILAIMSGKRPPRPAHPSLTDGLWRLIKQCWDRETHLRPHMLRVCCNFGIPAWKRLIDHPLTPNERNSLIADIFSDRDGTELVGRLRENDARSFVDAVDQMLDGLEPRLRKKTLSALCKICHRQALLPNALHIPLCYNRFDDPVYSGGYADVWMGEHQGGKVAVKVLRIFSTSDLDEVTKRFCKEVMMWKSLRHRNVLPLLGVTMGGKHFAMISEWMVNGNINEFIKANRNANRLELLEGVARGLIYLHTQAMVHGDLKGANVMVDQSGHARLADFGLLTLLSDPTNYATVSATTNAGTTRWMGPELLHPELFGFKGGRPTKQSDCYALGMVILEVLSGERPFVRDTEFIVMRKVLDGERPERPEGAWFTDDLWRTLEQCWSPHPNGRPTVEALLECLVRQSLPPTVGRVEIDGNESVSTSYNLLGSISHLPGLDGQVKISAPHTLFSLAHAGSNAFTEKNSEATTEIFRFHQKGGSRGDDWNKLSDALKSHSPFQLVHFRLNSGVQQRPRLAAPPWSRQPTTTQLNFTTIRPTTPSPPRNGPTPPLSQPGLDRPVPARMQSRADDPASPSTPSLFNTESSPQTVNGYSSPGMNGSSPEPPQHTQGEVEFYEEELEVFGGGEHHSWVGPAAVKSLLAGGVARVVSRTSTAPFDRLKVFSITRQPDTAIALASRSFGMKAITKAITSIRVESGILGFWIGNGVSVIKILPEFAIGVLSYESSKRMFATHWDHVEDPRDISILSRFVSSGIGNTTGQLSIYPIETVKTQMMSDVGGQRRTLVEAVKRVYSLGGMRAYYRGLGSGLLGAFHYSTISITAFEWMRLHYMQSTGQNELSVPALLALRSVAWGLGTMGAYPWILVQTRLQASESPAHPQRYAGLWDAISKTYSQRGVGGFYTGLGPTLAKALPAVSITYMVYEQSKRKLGA